MVDLNFSQTSEICTLEDLPDETDSTALRAALRNLADGDGFVSRDALHQVGGFNESVAAALETHLGPGPWSASLLEGLFGRSAGADTSRIIEYEDMASQAQQQITPPAASSGVLSSFGRRPSVRTAFEEHESQAMIWNGMVDADDDDDDGLQHLFETVSAVLSESPHGSEDYWNPGDVRSLKDLLSRTWRFACLRDRERQDLRRQAASARSEAQLQTERAAHAEAARAAAEKAEARRGEEAQELLEDSQAQLLSSREALRQAQSELKEARQRSAQLENESLAQKQRIQELEERFRRCEDERRTVEATLADTLKDLQVATAVVRQTEDSDSSLNLLLEESKLREEELRRLLHAADDALEASREELTALELRYQEALAQGRQRAIDLGSQLEESRRAASQSDARLRARLALLTDASSPSTDTPSQPSKLPNQRRATMPCLGVDALSEELGEVAAAKILAAVKAQEEAEADFEEADQTSCLSASSLRIFADRQSRLQEKLGRRQNVREDLSLSLRSNSPTSTQTGGASGGSSSSSTGSGVDKAGVRTESMPLNLQSLGRLLTGGGILSRKGE